MSYVGGDGGRCGWVMRVMSCDYIHCTYIRVVILIQLSDCCRMIYQLSVHN